MTERDAARGRPDRTPRHPAGRFAYEELDRALHEKARLGIMTSLMSAPDGLLFGDLKSLCSLTDGNLSRHLDVLRAAGLVAIWKGFENRRPQTLCRLTPDGRKRFVLYLEALRRVLRDATPKAGRPPVRPRPLSSGWQLT
jgi:DNA-binding transcriptional ArsR family regulator